MLTRNEADKILFDTNKTFKSAYPMSVKTRKSLGSIPPALHAGLFEVARRENVSVSVLIASMLNVFEAAG